ncbi:MAG: redoxin domain-containing protein [Phenylobacterium sp.]|uniref:SCO family protein n=1 Tax=Phenylobacterium sp. TaxID=1871053 RepID=UPI0025DA214F|nr:SCO family protein [Phenylobacterium sp.]MBI1197078.1 redoxin domain-containing protein [Phenylobacterium sp.]
MSRRILALIAVLALALAILTGLAVRKGVLGDQSQSVAVGGPFQLVDTSGHTVDQDLLKGKWSVVFFGFTHCPDVCPTTLFALGQVEPLLGSDLKDFQTVFISVDPERDTPEQMKAYVSNDAFPKNLVGLTGSTDQVAAVAKAYRVFYQKQVSGDDYVVNHSSYSYLMTPKGRFACVLPYGATPEQTASKIETAIKAGPDATSC